MAAVFPQAAACQENVTGPIEIPDHVLVRQTINDTLHEALDVDGPARSCSGWRPARCRSTSPTPPSRRCSPTRSSPPARTRSSTTRSSRTGAPTRCTLRRGLAVDLAAIGALDPEAIDRVHDEITPEPETADDLARPAGVAGAHPSATRLAGVCSTSSPSAAGARVVFRHARHASCGARPSARTTPATPSPTTRTRSRSVLRGHLEISGVTTAEGWPRPPRSRRAA